MNTQSAECPDRTVEQELYTVDQLARAEPALTVGQIRWLLFNRDENGLVEAGAVVQIGRRVLLRRRNFLRWASSSKVSA